MSLKSYLLNFSEQFWVWLLSIFFVSVFIIFSYNYYLGKSIFDYSDHLSRFILSPEAFPPFFLHNRIANPFWSLFSYILLWANIDINIVLMLHSLYMAVLIIVVGALLFLISRNYIIILAYWLTFSLGGTYIFFWTSADMTIGLMASFLFYAFLWRWLFSDFGFHGSGRFNLCIAIFFLVVCQWLYPTAGVWNMSFLLVLYVLNQQVYVNIDHKSNSISFGLVKAREFLLIAFVIILLFVINFIFMSSYEKKFVGLPSVFTEIKFWESSVKYFWYEYYSLGLFGIILFIVIIIKTEVWSSFLVGFIIGILLWIFCHLGALPGYNSPFYVNMTFLPSFAYFSLFLSAVVDKFGGCWVRRAFIFVAFWGMVHGFYTISELSKDIDCRQDRIRAINMDIKRQADASGKAQIILIENDRLFPNCRHFFISGPTPSESIILQMHDFGLAYGYIQPSRGGKPDRGPKPLDTLDDKVYENIFGELSLPAQVTQK